MTGGVLTQALANLGSNAIVEVLTKLETESITLSDQNSLYATYATKLEDEERVIRWAEKVEKVHDLVRALTPHIGARTFHPEFSGPIKVLRSKVYENPQDSRQDIFPGKILPANKLILVACGGGVLDVIELQASGGKPLSAADFLRGRRLEGAFYT